MLPRNGCYHTTTPTDGLSRASLSHGCLPLQSAPRPRPVAGAAAGQNPLLFTDTLHRQRQSVGINALPDRPFTFRPQFDHLDHVPSVDSGSIFDLARTMISRFRNCGIRHA